ncbi:hypothetical protein F2Q69_00048588 [Brassica cretica]|uniref:Uncharacterized protein n=1 Tax=Brassica cretica TaxID=69181 RepID=A0A8S9PPX1_BRACR|nr:hypothetical protein F2Q69_00048588 [Brassica cretica]
MSTHPTTWTNALRSETRVKERRSNLPPALEWRLDRTPSPSRARPMKNDSRQSHLHSGTNEEKPEDETAREEERKRLIKAEERESIGHRETGNAD